MQPDTDQMWQDAAAPNKNNGGDQTLDDDALLLELASLDSMSYDRRRLEAANKLGVSTSTLDTMV